MSALILLWVVLIGFVSFAIGVLTGEARADRRHESQKALRAKACMIGLVQQVNEPDAEFLARVEAAIQSRKKARASWPG